MPPRADARFAARDSRVTVGHLCDTAGPAIRTAKTRPWKPLIAGRGLTIEDGLVCSRASGRANKIEGERNEVTIYDGRLSVYNTRITLARVGYYGVLAAPYIERCKIETINNNY